MMCRELFSSAAKKLDCPIRMFPRCHPRSHLDVYVDARKRIVTLCCSKCDQIVATIKAKNGKTTNEAGTTQTDAGPSK